MKNLRNLLAIVTLMAVLMISASTAKAGIMMTDGLKNDNPKSCTETNIETKTDWGIIVQGFTGIIVQGFTGIIVQGAVDTPIDCGIIVQG
jgi:hypothetical protein